MRGGHGDLTAVRGPGLRRGRRGHPGHHRPGRAGQERLAVLHPPRVEQLVPGGQERLARARLGGPVSHGRRGPDARPAPRRGSAAGGRCRTAHDAQRRELRRAAAASGRPRCTSISSAIRRSTCRSDSTPGTSSAASKVPGRPSQFTNVPGFSATAATGNTTSARSVTALGRSSRLTTNGVGLQRRAGRRRVGQVVQVHAGDHQRVDVAPAAAARICAVSRPGVGGSEATPQARATSARACGSATRRPPGSRPGSAPASIAPRSPARRGIQASRAPVAPASRRRRSARRGPRPAARRPG